MVKVFPFKGITYNTKALKKQLAKLFAPPYDVISPEEQEALYQANDFNYIRVILGKEFPEDGEYNNKYIRAAAFLDGWLRHNILLQDEKPCLYVYEQVFHHDGKKYSRLGFIGLLRLEDIGKGKVYPHEETYPKAKLDRLQIMRATSANLESIFSLYSDEKSRIFKLLKAFMRRKPFIEVKDKKNVVHRLWKIDRKPAITKIIKEMKEKVAFIADGHHRYEAAIRFKNENKLKNTKFSEDESYNHIMMYFTAVEDAGLLILPIHRVVHNLNYFESERLLPQLEEFFEVIPYKAAKKTAAKTLKKLLKDMAKIGKEQHAFGLYLGNYRYYLLKLKDEKIIETLAPEEKPKTWKKLDVTVLRSTVLDTILNIPHESGDDKISYTNNAEEAVNMVDNKGCQLAFFLNPTKIEEIVSIASKLEKMPHKSTFFYPKLLSGLVLNKIVHGEKIEF